ncbi:ABC-F family ATP-binding cassette domain-containing protein [Sphingomonas sp. UYP23]
MSALLTLDRLSAVTPDGRILFDNLTLAVGAERIGLVGRNGSGKSTLLDIVAGVRAATGGSVVPGGRIGRLAQDFALELSAAEALGVAAAQDVLDRIEAGAGDARDFGGADWTLPERVAAALREVGMDGIDLSRTMATLSGGERTRVGIARLLIEAPDLILLDEPTNNLDAAGRASVAALLARWRGGAIIASHDRVLLEQVDRIVELTPLGIHQVGGGWSAFAAVREAERTRAAEVLDQAARAAREVDRAGQARRDSQARRDKAGRAFAASGSAPKILMGRQAERAENSGARSEILAERQADAAADRLTAARGAVEVVTPLKIDLPPTGLSSGRELLVMDAVTLDVGSRVLGPWTCAIRGPERVAVTGRNGAGKSSLLRVAMGLAAPVTGSVRRAEGRLAMLDQRVGLLDGETTLVDNFRRLHPTLGLQEAHAALAQFAFRSRDALRLAGTLSGGERLRAGLACVLGGAEPAQLLLLDEPTNHLDIAAIEVLEAAMAGFDGALLVVSHDRGFLDAVGVEREVPV